MDMKKAFGDWQIEKSIGEGAFGKVYKITREDFGHVYDAALKVIEIPQSQSEVESIRNEGMSEESVTQYFQGMVEEIVEEFALMSRLKGNSNIVSYEDHAVVPKEDGFGWEIYIRMELLTPLFTYIREHTLTVRDVIQLGIDICHALEVCQKYNIIHRDIKPENIFVSDIGTFKLGDFGIARQLEKTSSGLSKKGTFTYMAPEVYKGMEYNATVDIYSLGVVLYRFLNNNRSPFMPDAPQPMKYSDKERANVLRLSGHPMPKPCNADGELAEIVLKACAFHPRDRYANAREMREALEHVFYLDPEKKIVVPSGGEPLENVSAHYISQTKGKMPEENTEGTVYLFRPPVEEQSWQETSQSKPQLDLSDEWKLKQQESVPPMPQPNVMRDDFVESEIEKSSEKKKNRGKLVALVATIVIGFSLLGVWLVHSVKRPENMEDSEITQSDSEIVPTPMEGTGDVPEPVTEVVPEPATEVIPEQVPQPISTPEPVQKPKKSTKVTVLSVKGKKEKDAKALIERKKLKCKIKRAYSNTVKKGKVISQSVKKGTKVKPGTVITITVSKGKKKVSSKPAPKTTPNTTPRRVVPKKPQTPQKKPTTKKNSGKKNSNSENYSDWNLVN